MFLTFRLLLLSGFLALLCSCTPKPATGPEAPAYKENPY